MATVPHVTGGAELRDFPSDALEDLRDIRRAAAAEGGAEVIVMGVCSGADTAIETALARPVAAICVINPALSYVKWGRTTEHLPAGKGLPKRTTARRGGHRPPAVACDGAFRAVPLRGRWMPTPAWWIVKRWLMKGTPVKTLEHLVESGANVLLVVGSEESRRIYQGEQHG